MIKIEFDMHEVEERALSLGASIDQVPFAMATALNAAADMTRDYLIHETWPEHVIQRNTSFIGASLTTAGARATKNVLTVEIYDKLGRGHLKLHAEGGERRPLGARLAIPGENVAFARTAGGVPARLKPRVLTNAVIKGDVLYQRVGRGKNKRLRLMYVLKPSGRIPKAVPFYEDFGQHMRDALEQSLPEAVKHAMETRR
jgi:hypothetical protein